jgi:prephenate dehydratase
VADPAETIRNKSSNQEINMKLQFQRTMLLSTLLFAAPRLVLSQERPISVSTLTQSEAESLIKDLASHEEAWEQTCRNLAAIYREMAALSESDSAAVRELKRQYERLAESEERAAATAAERMAMYRERLAALTHPSPDVPKHEKYGDPGFRR